MVLLSNCFITVFQIRSAVAQKLLLTSSMIDDSWHLLLSTEWLHDWYGFV